MLRLGLLFTSVTLLEFVLLTEVGKLIGGLWPTVGLILFTGFLGAHLARQQGLRTLWQIQQSMQEGRMPTSELLDGVCILIAGALLLTPGFLTDIFGFALLTPGFRSVLKRLVQKRIERWMVQNTHTIVIEQSSSPPYV